MYSETKSDLNVSQPTMNSQSAVTYSDFDPLEDTSLSIRFDDFGEDFIASHDHKIVIGHYVIRRREVCFVCTGLLLFVLCIGLSVSMGIIMAPESAHHEVNAVQTEQCEDQQCFQLSSFMVPAMNRNFDPCENFGEFACGGFATVNPLLSGEPYNSMMDMTFQRMDERLRAILENKDLEDTYLKDSTLSYLYKTKQLYKSCVHDIYGARHGAGPLLDIIQSIGGWSVLNNWNGSHWDISQTIQTISGNLLVEVFVGIFIVPDRFNSKQNRIQLSIPHFSEEQTLIHMNHLESNILNEYKKFINATVSLLIENEQQRQQTIIANKQQAIKNFISDIIYMENRIYYMPVNKMEVTLQEIHVRQLQELFPWMDWLTFLNEVIAGVHITNNTIIYIDCLEYLRRTSVILQSISKRSLHNFLIWRLAREFLPYLSLDYQQILADYNRALPIQGFHSVGDRCINFLKISVMREALFSFLFYEKTTGDHHKQIADMLSYIRDVMFDSQLWVQDPQLRKSIRDKLGTLRFVVESEMLANVTLLNEFYEKLQVTGNYFRNVLNIRQFAKLKLRDSYNHPSVIMPLQYRNSYVQTKNSLLLIPCNYVYPPFFGIHYPKHVIYGRFGTMVAQIVLDYLSQTGVSNMFTKTEDDYYLFFDHSSSSFMKYLTECTLEMFQNSTVNGSIHGQLYSFPMRMDPVIIMKILATKVSYEAYKKYLKEYKKDSVVPGIGKLTLEQTFFLSTAQMMCENVDPVFLHSVASYGTPIGTLLINLITGIMPQFTTTYLCPTSSLKPSETFHPKCTF